MKKMIKQRPFRLSAIASIVTTIPLQLMAQGLPPLNIELTTHKGITIAPEPTYFERLLQDTTAMTIIVVAVIAVVVGFFVWRNKAKA